MASSFLNNLSSTYRQSPSLRNQFATEQDYLDLFDNQKTTPAMAKAFNIDDYEFEDEGIKSITNTAAPIINQGGDNDKGPTGGDYGYKGPGSTGSTTGFNIDDIGEGTIDDEDMPGITGKGLMGLAGFIANPVGFFAKKAFNIAKQKYDNKKARDKAAQDLAAAAANRAKVEAYTGRPMSDYRQGRPQSEQGFTGHGKSGMGRDPDDKMADGGRVGAKDGGSMIQIVKDRLMEKNPAMWGLGYEGLASLQDLIMSMPFNQGGIVNIRRR